MSTHENDIIKEGIMEDVYDMSVDELACKLIYFDKVAYENLIPMLENLVQDLFEARGE